MQLGCGVLTVGVGGCGLLGNWEVKVDRPYMLPGSAIVFALGLYDVSVQHSSLVNNGPWDVFIFCPRPEQHFLAGA